MDHGSWMIDHSKSRFILKRLFIYACLYPGLNPRGNSGLLFIPRSEDRGNDTIQFLHLSLMIIVEQIFICPDLQIGE
jgi:hypothetical protein